MPQLGEAGARHGTQPKLAAFTFVFVAHGADELDAVRSIIEQPNLAGPQVRIPDADQPGPHKGQAE